MRALLQRAMRVVLLVTLLGTMGSMLGIAGAQASPRLPFAGSGTPPVPTSSITPNPQPGTVTYCVDNYAFNSTVSVVNNANGQTGTIHTNANGHGCTQMPINTDCAQSVSNTIVASGTDQANKPASSQATYNAPPDSSKCGSPTPTPTGTATGSPTPTPTPTHTHPACPQNGHAQLSVHVTPQGGTIHGRACGFLPGESVDAFAHSQPVYLGTTTADSNGTVSATFTLPMAVKPGDHTWIYTGRTSGFEATAQFHVTNRVTGNGGGVLPGGGNGNGQGTGSNGLAFTGANIALMVLAALILLAVGTAIVVTVRRRRAASLA